MRKTDAQKNIIRHRGKKIPFFWTVERDDDTFMIIRNWITGEFRMITKQKPPSGVRDRKGGMG